MQEYKASRKIRDREVLVVVGQQGFGKTVYSKKTVETRKRSLIFDPTGGFDGLTPDDPDEMIEYVGGHEMFRVRMTNQLNLPVLYALANGVGNCTVVIDEAQRIVPAGKHEIDLGLLDLIYRGRHPESGPVDLIIIAQRPTTIHIAIRSQWTRLISFRQTEPADIAWMEQTSGVTFEGIRDFQVFDYYEVRQGQPILKKHLSPVGRLAVD